ncbi:MAG: winged helix-turn-helix transcriptional regulator [Proteobacteria bacterium]|nr:winged helix-turn-helix transcriptional regulator [Pseudomonadota bacterium]
MRVHFRQIEERCGVTGSQLWVLREVAHRPGIGVSELAERLSIHQSTCSQLVEKLAMRGYLTKERSREDQRRVGLVLQPEAVRLLKKAPGPAQGILPGALSELPEEVLSELNGGLAAVITQLELRNEHLANRHLADF